MLTTYVRGEQHLLGACLWTVDAYMPLFFNAGLMLLETFLWMLDSCMATTHVQAEQKVSVPSLWTGLTHAPLSVNAEQVLPHAY